MACDVDRDRDPDFVTGKRFWSHGQKGDPEAGAPAVLAWFENVRERGTTRWRMHRIDDDSGVGTQFPVGDLNGDGRPDIAIANKKGVFAFLQKLAH